MNPQSLSLAAGIFLGVTAVSAFAETAPAPAAVVSHPAGAVTRPVAAPSATPAPVAVPAKPVTAGTVPAASHPAVATPAAAVTAAPARPVVPVPAIAVTPAPAIPSVPTAAETTAAVPVVTLEQRHQQELLANAERVDKANRDLLAKNQELQLQNENLSLQNNVLKHDHSSDGIWKGALAVIAGFLMGWYFSGSGRRRSNW